VKPLLAENSKKIKQKTEYKSVTICVPTLKRESLISTLNSLYRQDYSKIVIVPGTHPSKQRNSVIKQCNTEFIAFIDDDCVAHPDFVKYGVKPFYGQPYPDFIQGCVQGGIQTSEDFTFVSANLWIRTEVAKKLLFNEEIPGHEDVDFCWRALDEGYKYIYNPECIVYHIGKPKQNEWNTFSITDIDYFKTRHKERLEKLVKEGKHILSKVV